MRTRRNIKAILIVFCVMFAMLSVYLLYILNAYGSRWFSSPYNTRVQTQKSSVTAGDITDRNGVVLAYTDSDGTRRYSSDKAIRRATSHIVGDNYGQTVGAEATFANYTLGFDESFADRMKAYLQGKTASGSDVALTIDAELCKYVYDLMDDYWGAVIITNYETGEILASVSQPTFDPSKMEEYISGERSLAGSAMVNRSTMGKYTPGSTFKIVTLIAALRYLPNVETRLFDCDGPLAFDAETNKYLESVHLNADSDTQDEGPDYDRQSEYAQDTGAEPQSQEEYTLIKDYHSEYHGQITLMEAFEKSCNTTFAKLAMEIGAGRMEKTAKELGIGKDFMFDDIMLYSSSYSVPDSDLWLAWSGVGQYKDIVTPLHMCMISGAIANDGVMMEPKLLKQVTSSGGSIRKTLKSEVYSNVLRTAEAQTVQGYMLAVVQSGTGTKAAVDGYDVGGKTGTAEITSDKSVKTHAWFTGFILSDEHPLAITVILEQAGGGGSVAAPLAGKALSRAVKLGY